MEQNPFNNEESKITHGLVVRLKSGGPKMTAKYLKNGDWICTWFHENEMREGSFDELQLEIVKE